MAMAVLARGLELELVMVRVLDGGHAEAAPPDRRNQPLDQRGLAAPLAPDDGDDAHQLTTAPSSLPMPQAARPAPPPTSICRRPPRNALWPVNRLRATPSANSTHNVLPAAT